MWRALALGILLALVAVAVPLAARAEEPPCEWLAGDFHVHTVYSHDSYGGPQDEGTGPDEFYTFGWTPGQQGAIAESRGLDFIAITDHNNIDGYLRRDSAASGVGFYESGWGRQNQLPGGESLIWVPDYENSVGGAGHAQMHGATALIEDKNGDAKITDGDDGTPNERDFNDDGAVNGDDVVAIASTLRGEPYNGAFQINHPSDMDWHDDAGNYEYPGFAPDALEIWNIGVWFYEPPMEATNDHEFTPRMYDKEFLDLGYHVAATGGSDNHWRSTTAVQGVGQPTTWVCASERSSDAIVQAVLANRTSISHQPPAYMGARAYLNADGDGDPDNGFESFIGDTVVPGSKIQARVENAEGAILRLITNGGTRLGEDTVVTSFNFSKTLDVPETSTWVRAEVFYPDGLQARNMLQDLCDLSNEFFGDQPDERNTYCENRLAMVAMTSPIYFEAQDFDPTTTLTYDGETQVRVGDHATLAATLLDANGSPLAGQAVTFTFRDQTYSATTDENGAASTEVRVPGPPGEYEVLSSFSGTDVYSPSSDSDRISVTTGNG